MDNTFTNWNCSIIGPNERIYELKLHCDINYPKSYPKIKFVSKINMNGVNQTTGEVDGKIYYSSWNNGTIQDALAILRKEMESPNFKKLKQPEEFTTFN